MAEYALEPLRPDAVPPVLGDLLFSGVAERPMWGRFLMALAARLGAAATGFVISATDPGREGAALLAARPEVAASLQRRLADSDLGSLSVAAPAEPVPGLVALRLDLDGDRPVWLVADQGGGGALASDWRAVLGGLVPLLTRILPLYFVIGDSERRRLVAEHVLESSGVGVVLVDAEGRVVSINQVAEAIIAGGGVLVIRGGRLSARRTADQRALAQAIRQMAGEQQSRAVDGRHAALALLRDNDAVPITAMVRPGPPFGPASAPLRRTATVILRDPARRIGLVAGDLTQLFQLTPAEARLACLLGDGASLDEAALQLGVTRNTARTQLRAIFAKTGTNRQGDLVRLLLTSTASNAQQPPGA